MSTIEACTAAKKLMKPVNREMRRSAALPENFDDLVAEAVQLKREVPSRSVNQIIMILELEGRGGSCLPL